MAPKSSAGKYGLRSDEKTVHSVVDTLTTIVKPTVSKPIDRRRILQFITLTGFTITAGVVTNQILADKKFTEIVAPRFRPDQDAARLLQEFSRIISTLESQLKGHRDKHAELFIRKVKVEWTVTTEEEVDDYEDQDIMDSDGNVVGTKRVKVGSHTETTTDEKYDLKTVHMDKHLTSLNETHIKLMATLKNLYADWQDARSRLSKEDLLELTAETQGENWLEKDPEEFSEHFGFKFKETELSTEKKIGVGALVAVPSGMIVMFLGKIIDGIKSMLINRGYMSNRRFYYVHAVKPTKMNRRNFLGLPSHREALGTSEKGIGLGYRYDQDEMEELDYEIKHHEENFLKRSIFRFISGVVAVCGLFLTKKSYENKSREIQQTGESKIRQAIVSGNISTKEELFNHFFSNNLSQFRLILGQMHALSANLGAVSIAEVNQAVKSGLADLDAAEESIKDGIIGADFGSVKTTIKENSNDLDEKNAYVESASQLARVLNEVSQSLNMLFKDGVPEILHPPMRAAFITENTKASVKGQESDLLWSLAGNIGLTLLGAGVVRAGLEMNGSHQDIIFNLVQGSFNLFDRKKMEAYELYTRSKLRFSKEEENEIKRDSSIRNLVKKSVENLKEIATAFEESEIVYVENKAQEIASQLNGNQSELINRIIEVYINKAYNSFVLQNSFSMETLKSLWNGKAAESVLVQPTIEELKERVMDLITKADENDFFVYDLIDSSINEDNEKDENWLNSESKELGFKIMEAVNHIAGRFSSVQSTYASLDILPSEWFMAEDGSPYKLSGEDILSFFRDKLQKQWNESKSEYVNNKQVIKQKFRHRVISDDEATQRLLLREIQEAMETHRDVEFILENISSRDREASLRMSA